MPEPTPVHERTAPLCRSYRWKDWAGRVAVARYGDCHEPEYYAIRHAAGLFDVSPLYKYDVRGRDAAALLGRMMVRDIGRLRVGRVTYCCWCDDAGKVIDDGTVARLDADHYRVTAAVPAFHWLARLRRGFAVEIDDRSWNLAALAVQGPGSRAVLARCAGTALDGLGFFGVTRAPVAGIDAWISRTGYTGDLGYEVFVPRDRALALWDALVEAGRDHGLLPCGLDALDMTRIEAGFVLGGVDYFHATSVVPEHRKSTPDEIGLGRTVELDREPFVGQAAIRAERGRAPVWRLVGLEVDWAELEATYDRYGLATDLPAEASRSAVPVYQGRRQVGQATSHTWSPLLKKKLALATVRGGVAAAGTRLQIEHTVEFERLRVPATVVATPFFDPERKRRP